MLVGVVLLGLGVGGMVRLLGCSLFVFGLVLVLWC